MSEDGTAEATKIELIAYSSWGSLLKGRLLHRHIMTGSYNNHFHIFGRESAEDVVLQASRDAIEGPHHILNPVEVVAGQSDSPSLPCLMMR